MYAYCAGNPVKYKDPSGHFFISTTLVIFGMMWMTAIMTSPDLYNDMNDLAYDLSTGNTAAAVIDIGGILLPAIPSRGIKAAANGIETGAKSAYRFITKNGDEFLEGASKAVDNAAHNAAQYDKLKTYYQQAEKYGTGSIKELPDGRFRFYEKVKPTRTQGEMAGARHVREWNPQIGAKREWYETVDHLGNIRQVRSSPDLTGGVKVHYMFDVNGKYTGSWSPK